MSELHWYQWLWFGPLLAATYITAFNIWFLFGLFIWPVGVVLFMIYDKMSFTQAVRQLYEGWTSWCFVELGFLGDGN